MIRDYYSSFICEHTAEYTLVPKLIKILKQKFEIAIPIFPWLTREGGSISKKIHSQDKFKIVGLYPRRPKISHVNKKILIKINHDLLDVAIEASKIKIPMIAGCPLIRNFWELNENTECIWIKLTDRTMPFYNIEYKDETRPEYTILRNDEIFEEDDSILRYINDTCKDLNIENFIEAIRNIKHKVFLMGIL